MSPHLRKIENQAVLLPPAERESLIQRLVYSLEDAPLSDIDEAWIQEAERRYREYKAGKIRAIPAADVFSEIRKEFGWQT